MDKFKDRQHAGELLAKELSKYAGSAEIIVLAIPRGGVEVAAPIAHELKAPLDLFITRKIGAPFDEEFAIGSLSETGEVELNEDLIFSGGYNKFEIDEIIEKEKIESKERVKKYRGHDLPSLKGKIVIVVDDGLATGFTMEVAVKAIKHQNPEKLVVAVPVAPPDAIRKIKKIADEVISLIVTDQFFAVGQFYKYFPQTSDETVKKLLK